MSPTLCCLYLWAYSVSVSLKWLWNKIMLNSRYIKVTRKSCMVLHSMLNLLIIFCFFQKVKLVYPQHMSPGRAVRAQLNGLSELQFVFEMSLQSNLFMSQLQQTLFLKDSLLSSLWGDHSSPLSGPSFLSVAVCFPMWLRAGGKYSTYHPKETTAVPTLFQCSV